MKAFRHLWTVAFSLGILGCSTSSGVLVNHSTSRAAYTSAYVVEHGGSGADMDALIQKELTRQGLDVTSGAEGAAPQSAQLVIKYADDWRWDLKMYLRSLDVMAFDAKSHILLATGSWKNSAFHGFYSEDKVVATVVKDTMAGINAK